MKIYVTKLPANCRECPTKQGLICNLVKSTNYDADTCRSADCPLEPLPRGVLHIASITDTATLADQLAEELSAEDYIQLLVLMAEKVQVLANTAGGMK